MIGFILLSSVKIFSHLFFRGHFKWENANAKNLAEIRLLIFLNHTSLYEPLFLQAVPFSFLWRLTHHAHIPGADITLNRPIVGRFWKLLFPGISTITRKKDETWDQFINAISEKSIIAIAPEGRMKRTNGLDKFGKPMNVRGGIADIIELLGTGKMLLCLSGGLHHVQAPGIMIPKLFKPISMNFVCIDIQEYLATKSLESRRRKIEITQDLEKRLKNDVPPPFH